MFRPTTSSSSSSSRETKIPQISDLKMFRVIPVSNHVCVTEPCRVGEEIALLKRETGQHEWKFDKWISPPEMNLFVGGMRFVEKNSTGRVVFNCPIGIRYAPDNYLLTFNPLSKDLLLKVFHIGQEEYLGLINEQYVATVNKEKKAITVYDCHTGKAYNRCTLQAGPGFDHFNRPDTRSFGSIYEPKVVLNNDQYFITDNGVIFDKAALLVKDNVITITSDHLIPENPTRGLLFPTGNIEGNGVYSLRYMVNSWKFVASTSPYSDISNRSLEEKSRDTTVYYPSELKPSAEHPPRAFLFPFNVPTSLTEKTQKTTHVCIWNGDCQNLFVYRHGRRSTMVSNLIKTELVVVFSLQQIQDLLFISGEKEGKNVMEIWKWMDAENKANKMETLPVGENNRSFIFPNGQIGIINRETRKLDIITPKCVNALLADEAKSVVEIDTTKIMSAPVAPSSSSSSSSIDTTIAPSSSSSSSSVDTTVVVSSSSSSSSSSSYPPGGAAFWEAPQATASEDASLGRGLKR